MMRKRRRRLKASTIYKIRSGKNKRRYTKKYLEIRNHIIARERWSCGLCDKRGCRLEVHHIQMWSKTASLRQNKRNLIALCKECHHSIKNKEAQYASIFKRIVSRNTLRFLKEKLTYDEYMAKLKEQQKLPESHEDYKYKTIDEVKRKKSTEHYLRKTWRNMKHRTTNKNNTSYHRYGGRGIKMYDEWINNFEKFKEYIYEHLGDRPENFSIDRINNDGNYEPGNIRWASDEQQKQNNSQTKTDEVVAEVMFILYHKYKFKQVQIMHAMGLNTPTIVRNCVKFKCWRNINIKYEHIVKEPQVLELIKQYDKKSNLS